MRIAGAALMAALLASAVASLRTGASFRLRLVGFLVGLTPMVLFLGASVNPSGAEIAAGLAVWASGIVLVRTTETRRGNRRSRRLARRGRRRGAGPRPPGRPVLARPHPRHARVPLRSGRAHPTVAVDAHPDLDRGHHRGHARAGGVGPERRHVDGGALDLPAREPLGRGRAAPSRRTELALVPRDDRLVRLARHARHRR